MLVAGDTEGAKGMNKWTEMMLKMTALKPQDDLRFTSKMTTTETGLLCALLGNNVIQAQKCFLVGLWLHTLWHRFCAVTSSHTLLCGVQTVRLETLVPKN